MEKQLELIKHQLIDLLQKDFGELAITKNIYNWPSLSWEEFDGELFLQGINLELCDKRDWETIFFTEKETYIIIFEEVIKLENVMEVKGYI